MPVQVINPQNWYARGLLVRIFLKLRSKQTDPKASLPPEPKKKAGKKMVKLNPKEARTDLTSRELSKLIGAFLGALVQIGEVEELKVAVKWWAETPEAWEHLKAIKTLFSVGGPVDIEKLKDGLT